MIGYMDVECSIGVIHLQASDVVPKRKQEEDEDMEINPDDL